jgi:hypothetical protein
MEHTPIKRSKDCICILFIATEDPVVDYSVHTSRPFLDSKRDRCFRLQELYSFYYEGLCVSHYTNGDLYFQFSFHF